MNYDSGVRREVYWHVDGGWYDVLLDVEIANLDPSDFAPPEVKHPFDKSYHVTYEQVQKMIQDAIEARIADTRATVRHYFAPPSESLITYEYLRETVGLLSSDTNALERRIMQLERPWWKRWLGR